MLPLTRVLAPLITNRIPLPPCSYTVLPSSVTVRPEPELIVTAIPLPPPCRKTLSLMDIAPDPSLLFTEIPQLPYSTTACDSATVPRPVTRIPPQSPDDGASLLDVKVISEPTLPATTRSPATTSSVRDMSVPPPVSSDNAWNRTVVPAARLRVSPLRYRHVTAQHHLAVPRLISRQTPARGRQGRI
jgi:hypothetical protein